MVFGLSVLMYFSRALWSSESVLLWPWWAVLVFSVFFWYLVFSVLMYFSQAVWSLNLYCYSVMAMVAVLVFSIFLGIWSLVF